MFRQLLSLTLILVASNCTATGDSNRPAPSCPVQVLNSDRVIDPAKLNGKVTYVDFWASWCGPCAASFPFMNQLHSELAGKGLEVVAINVDEERESATTFLKSHPAKFTIGLDPDAKCPPLYDVQAMPTSFVIDRKGAIRQVHLGFRGADQNTIRDQVKRLLAEP